MELVLRSYLYNGFHSVDLWGMQSYLNKFQNTDYKAEIKDRFYYNAYRQYIISIKIDSPKDLVNIAEILKKNLILKVDESTEKELTMDIYDDYIE